MVVVRDGSGNQTLMSANRPLLRVAQLAIHLDAVNED